MKQLRYLMFVLFGVTLFLGFYAIKLSRQKVVQRTEAHMLTYLGACVTGNLPESDPSQISWQTLSNQPHWKTVIDIGRKCAMSDPSKSYEILRPPTQRPGHPEQTILVLRKESLEHTEMGMGRWGLAIVGDYALVVWLSERQVAALSNRMAETPNAETTNSK